MTVVGELAKMGAKWGAKALAIPGAGFAFATHTIVKAFVSESEQASLDAVSQLTGCTCFSVLAMDFSPPTIRCVEGVAQRQHGCAFVFDGTAIYHPQTDMDVRAATGRVLRWNAKTKKVDLDTRTHAKRCRNCSTA